MKTKFSIAIIFISLMVIVSAGLINYYGKITATITVEGPVFYLDGSDNSLLLNEEPSESIEENLEGTEIKEFFSDSLGIDEFYSAKYEIKIRSKTNTSNSKLFLELWRVDSSNNEISKICPEIMEITIGTIGNWYPRKKTCIGDKFILTNDDKIKLKIWGEEGVKYNLQTGKYGSSYIYSHLKISKATI